MSGKVQMAFSSIAGALPFTNDNRVRPIATTGAKRTSVYPDVPTVIEAGLPGFEVDLWLGVFAPAGLPAPVLARLTAELKKALQAPDLQAALAKVASIRVAPTRRRAPPSCAPIREVAAGDQGRQHQEQLIAGCRGDAARHEVSCGVRGR